MKKIKFTALGLSLLLLASCGTMNQVVGDNGSKTRNGTYIGSGAGAATGALVGAILNKSHRGTGAIVGGLIGAAVGGTTGNLIGRHMDKVKAEVESQVENATVEEVTDANGLKAVKVTFDSGLLFPINKYELNASSKNDLAKFSSVLKNNEDCYVDIYGYTDTTGGDGINVPLSNNRANSVMSYLKQCGVSSSQLQKVEGKGSENPVASNSTESGRKQNRRVEVYLYASQQMVDAANAGTLK